LSVTRKTSRNNKKPEQDADVDPEN
jgi:hypothetical protein